MVESLSREPVPCFEPRTVRMGNPLQDRWTSHEIIGEPGWETVMIVLAETAWHELNTMTVEVWDDTERPWEGEAGKSPRLLYSHPGYLERRDYQRLAARTYSCRDCSAANQRREHLLLRSAGLGVYSPESTAAIAALVYQETQRRMRASTQRYRDGLLRVGGRGFLSGAVAELADAQEVRHHG